ncbi:GNAT family N-acetyltransferase [Devosia sp. Root436]|uniref:GNAT family N-acetyltransferase n=1 Tax=Devosia sp. Root436 TaxID=1736537 RepID=UPI0009E9C9C6|nr:GNAT family N-acetyltransferase [Devosia sp. Root436]
MTDWNGELTTHTGFKFRVRTAGPADEAALHGFFEHVTPEDLRFRFLTSVKEVGHDRLAQMTDVDHRQAESFVAFEKDGGPIIATAMLACDAGLETGEVAVSISAGYKNRGIGWELLRHVTRYAEAKGVTRLQSLEDRSNVSAIQLEREMGFTASAYPGDSTLVLLEKTLSAPS